MLSRYYQNSVILDDESLDTLRMTSSFDQQELQDVLDEIEMVLDIECSWTNDTVVFCKPLE